MRLGWPYFYADFDPFDAFVPIETIAILLDDVDEIVARVNIFSDAGSKPNLAA